MPKVVLHYFNVTGLGESIRLLLAYGGQEFEDHRVNHEEWPKLKSSMPNGQMPVLEIDGKAYTQSNAINRYLGKKYGIAGSNDEEAFEIDQNVDFYIDIRMKAAMTHYEQNEAVKEKKHEDLSKNYYPEVLSKLNSIIEKNNGHLAAGKLTWGDFVIAGGFEYFKITTRIADMGEKYPAIQKLVDNVYSIPSIKAYAKASA